MGKTVLSALVWLMLLFVAMSVAAGEKSGTITLTAGQGFNFSTGQIIPEKNSIAPGADIVFHDFIQTRERGLRITHAEPLSALYNLRDQMYFHEVRLFKNTGTIDDCVSDDYYPKAGIMPILSRSYCIVLDKKNEVMGMNRRTFALLKIARLGKDTITLDWTYFSDAGEEHAVQAPSQDSESENVSAQNKENPANKERAPAKNATPSALNEAPASPSKKILRKHNWKPWILLWAAVFAGIFGYEVWRGVKRR